MIADHRCTREGCPAETGEWVSGLNVSLVADLSVLASETLFLSATIRCCTVNRREGGFPNPRSQTWMLGGGASMPRQPCVAVKCDVCYLHPILAQLMNSCLAMLLSKS